MVSYKKKWLESEEIIRKLRAHSLDLSKEQKELMRRTGIPYLLYKDKGFNVVEQENCYEIYVVK